MAGKNTEAIATQLPEGARPLVRAGGPKAEDGTPLGPTKYARLRPLKDAEMQSGNCVEIKPGDLVAGVYVKSFVDEKFGKTNFVILTKTGEIVLTGGNLGSRMNEVKPGAYVEITYKGKSEMKSGKWKGTKAHNFTVDYEAI